MKVVVFLILFIAISCASGGNILFLVPFNGPSHWLFLSHFIKELLNNGHHVSAVTGIPYKGPSHANYTDILIDPPYDFDKQLTAEQVFDAKYTSPFLSVEWLYRMGLDNSEHGLKDENVQKLIKSENLHFDLIISEQFFQETWLMFAHKFKAPIITIASSGFSDYMDYANGLVTPWAYVPHFFVNFSDRMTFWQRCENVLLSLYDKYLRATFYMPNNNKLAKKYFGSIGSLPSIEDLERSIAVMLVNYNIAISKPRPQMPNQISIGGAHIKPKPSQLPNDLQKFLDESKHGVIYMSLGSYIQSSAMPPSKLKEILDAFSKLKQNVIWKFEDENIENLPKNVMVKKWLPQADILAHPNVKLFITHGGMFGTTEGTFNGKPMLFIPFFGDQHRNALKGEMSGVALKISFSEVTTETLTVKLNELLDNPKYYENAQEVARVFKDNPIHPMDTAMFYIEYVLRHKGAKYLKSAAVELSWYQHLLLDIILFGLCVLVIFSLAIYVGLKFVYKILFKKSVKKQGKSKKS